MLYLDTKDINKIGFYWNETIEGIEEAVKLIDKKDFDQPIKPYLNFKNPKNRIIAMPARGGGDINMSGIKWISSFPDNRQNNLPRAHSVTILNDSNTGVPVSIINSPVISGIRTASVSGLITREFSKVRNLNSYIIGMIGFGPIGQLHLRMFSEVLKEKISKILIFDINGVDLNSVDPMLLEKIQVVDSWKEAYGIADIFITCTVSSAGYIDEEPKRGSLLLNVSLRDFTPKILDYTRSIVVDNWEEVCRANTDIEVFHNERGLKKEETVSIVDLLYDNAFNTLSSEEAILVNPMGMALFDIVIANIYFKKAQENRIGVIL